jgi:raffinose/stachyose/melibiose transport system substrate-binding protein
MIDRPLSRRDALKIGTAVAGAAVLPAGVAIRAQEPVTLTFWSGTYTVQDPTDKTKDKSEFYIYQAIERFQAANPGITVSLENLAQDPTMFVKYRTASVAANGPDVASMWSGTYFLSMKDFIEPLGAYFTAEEKARILGWEAVVENFDPASPDIYGVPSGSDGTVCFFYNKELMTAAGVDVEAAWPRDFDGFVAVLEQIKASGKIPMGLESYGYLWHILMYWIAQTVGGSAGIGELGSGARKFNDPALVDIVTRWQGLAAYSAEGAETMQISDSEQLLFNNESVLTTGGIWIANDARPSMGDNLGMVKIPNFSASAPIVDGGIGGPGHALFVSNYSEHKDEAVAFIKFLMSPEEQVFKAQSGQSTLLNVADVNGSDYYVDDLQRVQQDWANEPSTIFWPDNTLPADLTTEINAQGQLAWTGQLSAEEFLDALDAKRDELLG